MDEPKVATVQGLAIMSCHEVSFMQDTRAWLYSGTTTTFLEAMLKLLVNLTDIWYQEWLSGWLSTSAYTLVHKNMSTKAP